jgi:hypothetical protein
MTMTPEQHAEHDTIYDSELTMHTVIQGGEAIGSVFNTDGDDRWYAHSTIGELGEYASRDDAVAAVRHADAHGWLVARINGRNWGPFESLEEAKAAGWRPVREVVA